MSPRPALAVAAAAFTLIFGASAQAAPVLTTSLSSGSAVTRSDCATTRLAGRPGVTTTSWTPSATSFFAARLTGGDGSDWDLAAFDHATGKRLGGSGAVGADEVVMAFARAGERVDLQGCRVSGAAASVPLTIDATPLPKRTTPTPKSKLVRISLGSAAALRKLNTLGLDLDEDTNLRTIDAVVSGDDDLAKLARNGFSSRVVVPDLAAFDRAQQRRTEAYSRSVAATGSPLPSGRSEYRHLTDYQAELKKLAQDNPALARPVTLKHKTYQGREVTGVEISSDVNRTDDQKPTAFIMGIHHAREWPAGEAPMEFAYYLLQGFGTDAEITSLLQRVRVVIVPVVNPDGYNSSREAQDFADQSGDPGGAPSLGESVAIGGSLAYRRKNCTGAVPSPDAPCEFQQGVDPNRNYGFGWGGPGASTTPSSQSYRGPGPWSEYETQNVHQYSQSRDVTSLLTMHNFASLVLRPPGRHDGGLAPDEARLKALGDAMGGDTGYTSQYGYQLYDTSGTTEDWNYGAAGTFGYTIEMGPESGDGGNFHIAYDRAVVEQWTGGTAHEGRGLRRALLRIAESSAIRQNQSTLIGRAPAGRILHLHKAFKTSTSPICQLASPSDVDPFNVVTPPGEPPTDCVNPGDAQSFDDGLDYKTTVPANGVFSWIVTPSTRPFEYKAGKREAWTLTCEDASGKAYETRDVTIWRNEVQSYAMPCGGTLAGPAPATFAQAQAALLADKTAPSTAISRKTSKASRSRILLRGTAADTAPKGLRARVAKVRVAIARRTGKLCRFLSSDGTFGTKLSCHRTSYAVAQVAKPASRVHWRYLLGEKLPKGRYLAWSRAIDAAGNVERKAHARNLLRFTIR